ncbi:hypothetical protein F1559_004735 [Cyanidiococcus yangmingshanensis]|uniref:S1 motif domain-containing protein n=1 Tax=Cyanidiococcus yangmingshanensis TaxID=2690220 RepID=A0A7J7INL8_9RHOD|nr:hypothetical protein F1559_004735 [Cyanidiococcus yangmingshanensis]
MGQPNAVTLPKVAEGGCFPRGQDERAGAEQRRSALKRTASDRTSRRRPPLKRESQGRESDGLAIAALQTKPLLVRSASAEQLSTPTWLQVRDLQPGTLTLGCIVSVQQHYAVVMLPFGIWGVLPLSSRPVGELDGCLNQPDRGGPQTGLVCADSTPALPLSVLRQSLLRVCVMNWPSSSSALEPERISVHQGRTRECSILLSADPRFVNRGLGLSEKLHDYGLIQVRLSLPLDHTNERFEVEALAEDSAQNRRILLRSTEENDKDHAGCRPGRICWAALESWHEQRRVAVLSNEHAAIVGALTRGHWTLEQLSPGMLVDGRVIRRYTSYALVRFLDVFDGILEWFHLDRIEDFNGLEPGRELRVRILYIDLARRYIALSARTSLTERLELPLTVAAARRYHRGCFVEHLQVTRVDRSRGIWFHKDGETVRFFADRHAISDERSGQLEHLFPPGKIMSRARVISHMAIEGIVRVTLKPSLLQRKFLDYAELEAGALVRCSIVGWENSSSGDAGREKRRSLLVDVEGCLPGCIPVEHLTDVPMRLHRLEKKFPKGSSLRCRVWDVQPKKKRVLLTARKSLVESSLPVLAGWDQVKIGQVYHGLVADRDGTGSYRVLFYKRISGILLSNPAMKAAALTPGQVICVRVDRILERRRKQLMVSLANDVPMETGGELPLTCGSIVRIQRAFQDQVGRILAIAEGASESDGAQPIASTGTRLVLLPMQHLTDYPMLRGHWASETGLQALAGELAVVLDNGADGSMPLISHRWTILRASQLSMLPAEISGPVTVGTHGVGLVHAMEPTLAYIVMRLGVSHRRVRVQRPLLADRFVETSTQVLEEGQLVFYHVRKGRRFSLRYSDIRAALDQEPFRQLCLEIRALDALVREQMRLWQRWGHLKSSSSLPPLPGSLVRAHMLRVTAETMDVDVQHEQDLYRGTVDPYHFPEEEHIEAMSAEAVTEGETRSSTGLVFTALVLWSDPLCNQLVLSRRSSLLRTAPWCWLGQNGEPPKCLRARVLATYGEIAILWSKHGLAFMSTLDINGRARERPCFVGQELNVTADGRTPPLAGEDPPTWVCSLLRASVRPAVAGKESPDRRREESSTVGTRRHPVSIMQVGALVSTAQVTAVHPFQVHVRWAGGHTGRIHMTNVDDEKTFVALKVGSTLPQARIVAQRKARQWELSLRKRDLETTTNPRIDSKVSVGDLFDLAVVKQTDRDSKGLIRTVRLYIRPDMVARLSRFEATPRILDDSWVPGHFVRQLRLLRIDKARRRYYLTAVEPMAAGQCIAGARIRSLHPGDGLVRVQLPRGRLGVLFVGNMAPSQSRHPFEEIRITQKLDVYLLHDWDQSSSDEVPVTAIRGQGPIAWKQLHQGDLVDAFVRRVDNAGVFVNLAPGLVARCLLRDLASGFVQDPVAAFPVGMRVRAMVVDSGVNERHIRVSFRAAQESGSEPWSSGIIRSGRQAVPGPSAQHSPIWRLFGCAG